MEEKVPQSALDQREPIEILEPCRRKVWWLNGVWELKKRGPDAQAFKIIVPGVWNSLGPEFRNFVGDCVYRREFNLPRKQNKRYRLHFLGVLNRFRIRVNGKSIDEAGAGFVPASFEITSLLEPVANVVEVLVSNRVDENEPPDRLFRARDGGIFREVYIEETPEFAINDVTITPLAEGGLTAVSGSLELVGLGEKEQPKFEVKILDPTDEVAVRTTEYSLEGNILSWKTPPAPMMLWTLNNPVLFRAEIAVEINGETDGVTRSFGVRELSVDNGRLYLNGDQIKLFGVVRVEDTPGLGPVQTREVIESDIRLIKEAGFNAVRAGLCPAHPYFLDCCDREGLLVLDEIPVSRPAPWSLARKKFREAADSMLRALISRDRNHPSVIMWGIGSDLPAFSPPAKIFVRQLAETARSLDSRPLYATTHLHKSDPTQNLVDVVALNFSPHWFHSGRLGRIVNRWTRKVPEKPILITQTVAGARKDYLVGLGRKYSEQEQAKILVDNLKAVKKEQAVSGVFIGHLTDFRDPGAFADVPGFENHTGLSDYRRQKKLAFGAVRDFWFDDVEPQEKKLAPMLILPMLSTLGVFACCLWLLWFVYYKIIPNNAKFLFSRLGDLKGWSIDVALMFLIIMVLLGACSLSIGVFHLWKNTPLHAPFIGMGGKKALSVMIRIDLVRIVCAGIFIGAFFGLQLLSTAFTRTPLNTDNLVLLIRPFVVWILTILLIFGVPIPIVLAMVFGAHYFFLGYSPVGWGNAGILMGVPILVILGALVFLVQMEAGVFNLIRDHSG